MLCWKIQFFLCVCDFHNSFILTKKGSCEIKTSLKKCQRLLFKNVRTVAVRVVFNKIMNMSAVRIISRLTNYTVQWTFDFLD